MSVPPSHDHGHYCVASLSFPGHSSTRPAGLPAVSTRLCLLGEPGDGTSRETRSLTLSLSSERRLWLAGRGRSPPQSPPSGCTCHNRFRGKSFVLLCLPLHLLGIPFGGICCGLPHALSSTRAAHQGQGRGRGREQPQAWADPGRRASVSSAAGGSRARPEDVKLVLARARCPCELF